MRALIALAGLILTGPVQAQLVPDIQMDGDKPTGVRSTSVQIEASGETVYVFWRDRRNGQHDVFFNRSIDGGKSWLTRSKPVPGAKDVDRFRVAVWGDAVSVVWKKDGGGIFSNRSENQGNDWIPAGPGIVTGTLNTEELQVAVSGQFLYVVWREEEAQNHHWDVHFRSSADRGQTWASDPIRLDTDPRGTANSVDPKIAVSGDAVYVVWEDKRDGVKDIYFNRSLDHGASWLQNDLRLDRAGFSPTRSGARDPAITAAGNSVYVVWRDERAGEADIYFNASTDYGNPTTWLGSDKRLESGTPGAVISRRPRIAASGEAVYVVWENSLNSQNVYFNSSTNKGGIWAGDTRLTSAGHDAEITASGDAVYVVWSDSRNSDSLTDSYFNRSLDQGKTWRPSDILLNTGGSSFTPEIAASGHSAYVAWETFVDDIYFNVAHAPVLPYGEGLAGSGGIVPVIGTGGTDPSIGTPFQIVLENALGGSPCAIAISLDRVEQPLQPSLGGTVYGDFFTPGRFAIAHRITSGPNLAGHGVAVLPFPIPNDPSLLGKTYYFQGFVADAGSAAPIGVSHTGGLAVTVIR